MRTRIPIAPRMLALFIAACNVFAAPVRVVVLQDKTGSANWTRTPQLTLSDFDRLIDLLKARSGEVAFGLIRDSSNRGLLRLRIDSAPVAPEKPAQTGRVFDDARSVKAYRQANATYHRQLEQWQTATDASITLFKSSMGPLLDQPANARATDVFGAIRRGDLLLAEPQANGAPAVHAWLIAATDGDHNNGPVMMGKLRSGARLVVINSAGRIGSLKVFAPITFESISSAMRFMIEAEK